MILRLVIMEKVTMLYEYLSYDLIIDYWKRLSIALPLYSH